MNVKVAIGLVGAWASLFAAGGWAGKRFSHDWGDVQQVKYWAANRLEYRADSLDGNPSGVFSFRCGPDTFAYRLGSAAPQIGNAPGAWQGKELERKPITVDDVDAMAKVLGLPAFATAPALIEALKTLESKNYAAAMAVGALAGFGLGFYLNYETAPTCPEIKTALRDQEFWRSLEAPKARNLYALKGVVVRLPASGALPFTSGAGSPR